MRDLPAANYESKGKPVTGGLAGGIYFQVTGDGPLGLGHSGVGVSAIGYRLQVHAADS
jgi:hypothetical protein